MTAAARCPHREYRSRPGGRRVEAAAAQTETPAAAFPIPRDRSPAPRRPLRHRLPRERRRSPPPPTASPTSPSFPRSSAASPHSPPVPRREAAGQPRVLSGPGLATSPAPPAFRYTPQLPPGCGETAGAILAAGTAAGGSYPAGGVTVIGNSQRPRGPSAMERLSLSPGSRKAPVARRTLT